MTIRYMSFELEGSFMINDGADSKISPEPQPESGDNSAIFNYIADNFPPTLSLTGLLREIEKDHDSNPDLYLIPQEVVVIPKEVPTTPAERVQCLKNMLPHVFTNEQVETSASGFSQLALDSLKPWQKHALSSVLAHFHKFIQSKDYYQKEGAKIQLIDLVLNSLAPKISICRIAAPVHLVKGALPTPATREMCLTVTTPTEITLTTQECMAWPQMTFDNKSHVNDVGIRLLSNDTNEYCDLKTNSLNKTLWRQILWPMCSAERSSIHSVVDSCRAYANMPLCAAAASGLAKVMSTVDNSFLLSLYNAFSEDSPAFGALYESLITLFASEKREQRILKLVSYAELKRTINPNEIFRKNNNYFRSITNFFNRVCDEYKRTTLKNIYPMIAKSEKWKFDDPKEKDHEIASDLLKKFFTALKDTADTIPTCVRVFCRYLRLASEYLFRDQKLIHRAMFAGFLFRFVFPSLVNPGELGYAQEEVNPAELIQVLQFTKLLSFAAQLQHITGDHQGERKEWNAIIDKNAPIILEFYDVLCQPVKYHEINVTKAQIIEAATTLRDFILKNEQVILNFKPPEVFESLFVDELVAEFIARYPANRK